MARRRAGDLDPLISSLGHRFSDRALLEAALTHPSAVASPGGEDNQRLEFLGDRVLGLVIAEALLSTYPDEAEGSLAPRYNALVRRETLAAVAGEIGLGPFLRLGRSEATSGGRRKAAILADAMEALIAALFLDGGLDTARDFVLARWSGRLTAPAEAPTDAKTRLQEWAQGRGMAPPDYRQIDRTGPDHAPLFVIEARLASGESARGEARSKKQAEQEAAAALLGALGVGA